MGSTQQQAFYSTPAFERFRRALTTTAIQHFRGMNSFQTAPQITPDVALDCLNVIVSPTGGLEKFRLPVSMMSPIGGFSSGPFYISDFQYYLNGVIPTRQPVINLNSALGGSLYFLSWNFAASAFLPTLIEGPLPADLGPWSMVEANNTLYMANGQRMAKYLGSGGTETWGIPAPNGAPSLLTVALPGTVNLVDIQGFPSLQAIIAHVANPPGLALTIGQQATVAGTTNYNGTYTVASVAFNSNPEQIYLSYPAGTHNDLEPALGTIGPTQQTLNVGWSYAFAWKNSVTGHVSSRSVATAVVNPTSGQGVQLSVVPLNLTADPQVDTIVWYRTLDGGGTYFRLCEVNITTGAVLAPNTGTNVTPLTVSSRYLSLNDNDTPDLALDTLTQASLVNNPPPVGKYLVRFQGRIFVINMVGAPQDMIWSGYEQITTGRPEESFPPFNRVHMSIGAEELAGGGALQTGVITWSRSGTMWALTGQVQDITTNSPVVWTDYFTELPWTMGNFAHASIQPTPYGLIWFAGDKSVNLWPGSGQPSDISEAIKPYLKRITAGTEYTVSSSYFNWLDRDWYVLLCAIDGSTQNNIAFFFSLNKTLEQIDIFPLRVQADWIAVLEDPNHQRRLVIGQNGGMAELKVQSLTVNGITQGISATSGQLAAYWRGGYFGNDQPYLSKMFRGGTLIADNGGFSVTIRVVNNREWTFAQPFFFYPVMSDEYFEVNLRGHRCSVEINFPSQDVDCGVVEYSLGFIGTADRRAG